MPRPTHFLVALLVPLLLGIPKLALAAGLSADPRIPTAPIEQVVVTSTLDDAVVSVWPKRAGKVYVLPKPKGVVPGSVQVLQSGGMTRLDRETALPHVHAKVASAGATICTGDPGPTYVTLPPERPLTAREWAREHGVGLPQVITCGMKTFEDLACDARRALPVAFVESNDTALDAEVRSRGGELPASFVPEKGASYWVFQNLGGAMVRFRTSGLAELPIVPEAKGGSHETLLIVLMRSSDVLGERTFHTAMFPAELDALPAGGVYAMPQTLSPAAAEAALAESRYAAGDRAVVVRVTPLWRDQLTFDACSAAGLGHFYSSFEGVAVRARIRSLETLSFRERRLRPPNDGFFLTVHEPPGKSVLLDEKVCLEFTIQNPFPVVTTRPSGAPPIAFRALTLRPSVMVPMPTPPEAPPVPLPVAPAPTPPPTAAFTSQTPAPPPPAAHTKVPRPPGGCAAAPVPSAPAAPLVVVATLAVCALARRRKARRRSVEALAPAFPSLARTRE